MSPYDESAWAAIEQWRSKESSARTRSFVPAKVRGRAAAMGSDAKAKFDALPGAARFEELLLNSLSGLTEFAARGAAASLRSSAVVNAFAKRGHDVTKLRDVLKLELEDIDQVKPNLFLGYTAGAMAGGAGSGLAVSGGEILAAGGAIAGAGAGAARQALGSSSGRWPVTPRRC